MSEQSRFMLVVSPLMENSPAFDRAAALAKAREWATHTSVAGEPGGQAFDIIFLDPPYHQDALAVALPLCAVLLRPGGMVYAEAEMPLGDTAASWLQDWEVVRADQAGMVFYHLLRNRNGA